MLLFLVNDSDFVQKCANITWRNESMRKHINEVAFRGDSSLPDEIVGLQSPLDIFSLFFNDELINLIVEQTNLAARQENINTNFSTSADEIRKFIGIYVYMSIVVCPNMYYYWDTNWGLDIVADTMPRARFLAIKQFLSFADESKRKKKGEEGHDRLFRVRNFANILNGNFDAIPKNARLCVDEQMCATKTRHHLRQYMPNKPHKWGVKLFVLCDSHGFAYR